jgi:hypothetical protein
MTSPDSFMTTTYLYMGRGPSMSLWISAAALCWDDVRVKGSAEMAASTACGETHEGARLNKERAM